MNRKFPTVLLLSFIVCIACNDQASIIKGKWISNGTDIVTITNDLILFKVDHNGRFVNGAKYSYRIVGESGNKLYLDCGDFREIPESQKERYLIQGLIKIIDNNSILIDFGERPRDGGRPLDIRPKYQYILTRKN